MVKKVGEFEVTVSKIIKKNEELMKMQPNDGKQADSLKETTTGQEPKFSEKSDEEKLGKES